MKFLYENRHDEGRIGSKTQGTDMRYSNQLLGSDDRPADMINPESVGLSTVLDIYTAVQQVNEVGMPKLLRVVTEFAETLLRLAKWKKRSAASQLAEVLQDPTFDL